MVVVALALDSGVTSGLSCVDFSAIYSRWMLFFYDYGIIFKLIKIIKHYLIIVNISYNYNSYVTVVSELNQTIPFKRYVFFCISLFVFVVQANINY